MSERRIFEGNVPKTQSIEAVKSLLACIGRATDPLPSDISLDNGRLVLILSDKKDVYYVTTPSACSCPSAANHPGQPCGHMKALLVGLSMEASRTQAQAYQARQRELRRQAKGLVIQEPAEPAKKLAKPPEDNSIRPTGEWIGPDGKKANGPIASLPFEKKPNASVFDMLIDLHDTLPGEVAYWERKHAVELLKSEA